MKRSRVREVQGRIEVAGIFRDRELRDEILNLTEEGRLGAHWGLDSRRVRDMVLARETRAEPTPMRIPEAIVRLHGRPSLLVRNDKVEMPPSVVLSRRLKPHVAKFTPPLKSVGRVELIGHPSYEWVGTGWMIDEGTIATNRHVAALFAREASTGRGYLFVRDPSGAEVVPRIDFREEFRGMGALEFEIDKVLFVAPLSDRSPDVAFMSVKAVSSQLLPDPIPVHKKVKSILTKDHFVAVVGYPARDSRSDPGAMNQVFGEIYDVKRFAPGVVMNAKRGEWWFTHDCSTLGGNSGSVVLDIETGRAIGLHFAGMHGKANYAVRIDTVRDMLASARDKTIVRVASSMRGLKERVRPRDKYTSTGYDERFLGPRIPMPTTANKADLVRLRGDGRDGRRLNYMHFSVRLSKSRRLPAVTAVNIDGRSRRKVPRKQSWFFDSRIHRDLQVGKEFYGPSGFDRGHMVRREDPVWGPERDAKVANEDTFHYTNAAPQHPDLNQREWVELEDYILDNADSLDLKVSVFTGPVFDEGDPVVEGVKVPLRYWKVAAAVDHRTGKLAAAGYILSQQDLVAVEFRYGPFKVYQVPIREIERAAGIRVGQVLRDADGYDARIREAPIPSWSPGIEIRRPEDVRLT